MRMPFKRTGTVTSVVEQRRLLRGADQPPRKCPCFNPSMLIKLAELRYRLLNDAPTDTNAAHQAPIAVKLPILPYCRVAQIHAPNQIRLVVSRKYPRLALHAQISHPRHIKSVPDRRHTVARARQPLAQLRQKSNEIEHS